METSGSSARFDVVKMVKNATHPSEEDKTLSDEQKKLNQRVNAQTHKIPNYVPPFR